MPRTFSDCYEGRASKTESHKGFGSFPNIFYHPSNTKIQNSKSTTTESIHFIKHIPVRLTRTRASCPSISNDRYSISNLQAGSKAFDEQTNAFERTFPRVSNAFYNSTILEDEMMPTPSDDLILTPFAQVLSNLHSVRRNIGKISDIEERYRTSFEASKKEGNDDKKYTDRVQSLTSSTCDTLDWCLETLENVQTHRAVSDLTARKFQRILNQELQQTNEDSVSDIQLCDYICETFQENQPIDEGEYVETVVDFENDDKFRNPPETERGCFKIFEKSIDIWGIDLFEINDRTDNVLTLTMFAIFKKRQFLQKFKISYDMLLNFSLTIEKAYRKVPYHNSIHAADVTQSSHVILNSVTLKDVFTDLEMFAVIFASAIHDIDHPGVTNQYLININDPLATLYNDHSILENHHLATAFGLLKDSKIDILSNLNKQDKAKFRKLVIDMVLATDMAGHMSLLADLKTMVETKRVVGSGLLNLDNYHDRIKILQCLLHCSDLSNPTKPISIYQKWVTRIFEEFHNQGDKEKQLGIDISPMCDRSIDANDKTQVGFIDYIVKPLWETWADLTYPDAQIIIDNLNQNHRFYSLRTATSNVEI